MNQFYNSWPEEQQHLQRHQDLIQDADRRRLVKSFRQANGDSRRSPGLSWAWLRRLRCRLYDLAERLPARLRPAVHSVAPTDCG